MPKGVSISVEELVNNPEVIALSINVKKEVGGHRKEINSSWDIPEQKPNTIRPPHFTLDIGGVKYEFVLMHPPPKKAQTSIKYFAKKEGARILINYKLKPQEREVYVIAAALEAEMYRHYRSDTKCPPVLSMRNAARVLAGLENKVVRYKH